MVWILPEEVIIGWDTYVEINFVSVIDMHQNVLELMSLSLIYVVINHYMAMHSVVILQYNLLVITQ